MKPLYRHRIVKRDGKWRWLLRARNGRTVAEGRAVARRSVAERMVMRLFGAVLLVLLAFPVTASAADWYAVSEWAVLTGHALDAASSQRAFAEKRGVEANHFLAQFDNPITFTAAKFVVGGGQLWAMRKLKAAGHPRWAMVANFAIGSGFVALAVRNQKVGK